MSPAASAQIETLRRHEAERYAAARPKSRAAFGNGIANFVDGVPMHWMSDWPRRR